MNKKDTYLRGTFSTLLDEFENLAGTAFDCLSGNLPSLNRAIDLFERSPFIKTRHLEIESSIKAGIDAVCTKPVAHDLRERVVKWSEIRGGRDGFFAPAYHSIRFPFVSKDLFQNIRVFADMDAIDAVITRKKLGGEKKFEVKIPLFFHSRGHICPW